jgi:peroxiredoxin
MRNQLNVDWSTLPIPIDDGTLKHLQGQKLPEIKLNATDGAEIDLSLLKGLTVVYAYPRTGRPDEPVLDGWDVIPGARGCTPQSCAFRDHFTELTNAGVDRIFGLSTQDTSYQQEAVKRLALPFSLLSDDRLIFSGAVQLPTFHIKGLTLLKRFTMIIRDGTVLKVFYPVFPPDQNAAEVVNWLHMNLS